MNVAFFDRILILTSCTSTQLLLLPQPQGTHKGHPYTINL